MIAARHELFPPWIDQAPEPTPFPLPFSIPISLPPPARATNSRAERQPFRQKLGSWSLRCLLPMPRGTGALSWHKRDKKYMLRVWSGDREMRFIRNSCASSCTCFVESRWCAQCACVTTIPRELASLRYCMLSPGWLAQLFLQQFFSTELQRVRVR